MHRSKLGMVKHRFRRFADGLVFQLDRCLSHNVLTLVCACCFRAAAGGSNPLLVLCRMAGRGWIPSASAAAILLAFHPSLAAAQQSVAIGDRPRSQASLALQQALRVGSLSGDHDAFARISFVALRHDGSVLIADDQAHQVTLYDRNGRFVKRVGRRGQGPGEFETPWLVSVTRSDSAFVWDHSLGRVSVFSPTLQYVRSFRVPGPWLVNSLRELPSGKLLFSGYDTRTKHSLHITSRDGSIERSFAPIVEPPALTRFQTSLLGGTATVVDSLIVFSHKSPYRIDVFDLKGRHIRTCMGSPSATTRPETVIEVRGGSTQLHWDRYVHSTALLAAPMRGAVLNLIVDRVNERRILDAIDITTCQLLRRAMLPAPVFLTDAMNGRIAGFMELDYPEVVVYTLVPVSPR